MITVDPQDLGIGRLFEKVYDGIIVADPKSQRIVLWNSSATRIFGYSAKEAYEMTVESLVPESLKALHRAGMARYAATGSGSLVGAQQTLELPALRKDRKEIYVELSLSPIMDQEEGTNGGGRYVLAIVREITERREAEELASRLAAIVESSDDAIIGKTLDGVITSWNKGARMIYGYTAEEAIGMPISMLVPPDPYHFDEVPSILRRVRRGESVEHYETVRLRKDGSRVQVSVTVSPVRDSHGNVTGASAIARDITERKKVEEELRHMNDVLEERVSERTAQLNEQRNQLKKLVGQLVASQEEERRRVAYEVHDGLTQIAIAAYQRLQVFAATHPPGATVESGELDPVLELVQKTVKEARRVIEGLRPTALDDYGLGAALRIQIHELEAEGLKVSYREDLGDEKRLPADLETALYRVAQEALTNIKKHARSAQASVFLNRLPGKVRLEVKDNGRGFDPSVVASKTVQGPGERVGLCSMHERISMFEGELKIESKPGCGTAVIAEVPVSLEHDKTKKAGRGHAG